MLYLLVEVQKKLVVQVSSDLNCKKNIFMQNQVFNKNFDLVSFFYPNFEIVRYIFLVIYMICIYDILYNIFSSKKIFKLYLWDILLISSIFGFNSSLFDVNLGILFKSIRYKGVSLLLVIRYK